VPPRRIGAVAFVAALAVAGCSSGDDGAKKKDDAKTSSAEFTHAAVKLGVSKAELVSPHAALGPLEQVTTDAVVAIVQELLLDTSAKPLVEGKPGTTVADLFTTDAGTRVAGPDRKAFFDDAVGTFGPLTPKAARVRLTGLAGSADPTTALVVAKYVWDVTSTKRPTDRVTRNGELSLVKVGNQWKIAAYAITVTRTVDGETTTTTAAKG
jgi:hypothetical protein